jgi:hypothetical protein
MEELYVHLFDQFGLLRQGKPLQPDALYLYFLMCYKFVMGERKVYKLINKSAPKILVLVASGFKVESKTKDDSQTVTFAAGPARDFYLVASRRFTVTSTVVGETTINNYFFPEMVGVNLAASAAEDSLNSLSVRLGEYPCKELDIVPLHLQGNALGVEYPGIFGVNIETYSRQDFLQSTVAHETAHQWFYNMIGNDQVNEPWLDEALSQYMTSLYFLDRYGENGRQSYRQSWIRSWNKVNNQSIPIGLPVSEYLPNEYSPIVYGRGPLFMEALAEKIGQKTFDSCLRQYCISNRWQIVNSTSFKSHFENCSSSELNELFQNWVYSK